MAWFRRRTGHLHDAEDLAADVVLRVLDHTTRKGPPRCTTSIALHTARNLLCNYRRDRHRRHPVWSDTHAAEPPCPHGAVVDTHPRVVLHALRAQLRPDLRDTLNLVLAGASSPRELAALRATSVRSAQQALGRLRAALQEGNFARVVRERRRAVSPARTQENP